MFGLSFYMRKTDKEKKIIKKRQGTGTLSLECNNKKELQYANNRIKIKTNI